MLILGLQLPVDISSLADMLCKQNFKLLCLHIPVHTRQVYVAWYIYLLLPSQCSQDRLTSHWPFMFLTTMAHTSLVCEVNLACASFY